MAVNKISYWYFGIVFGVSWCVTHKKYVLLALVQSIPAWYLIGSKKTNGVLRLGRKLLKINNGGTRTISMALFWCNFYQN